MKTTALPKLFLLLSILLWGGNVAWAADFVSALTEPTGTVGRENNTSEFWQYHSMEYVVPDGKTYTVVMTNYTAGTGNHQNFNIVINNGTASYNNLGGIEYLYLRNDNYGWGTYYNNSKITNEFSAPNADTSTSDKYWAEYRKAMAEAQVSLSVSRSGNEFLVSATITPTNTTDYPQFTYTYAPTTVLGMANLGFSLTIEGGHLDITSATLSDISSTDVNKFVTAHSGIITTNKGDITSMINGDFEANANGWTGGTWWSPADWRTRSWRGTDVNGFYELGTTGTLTSTVYNMPAGTYKVVAAARSYVGGQLTAQIAGTSGTTLTGVGDSRTNDDPEINTNGVEMPYSSLGGFTSNSLGHNWRWITATGVLNETGNLVININGTGTSWMAIDDVHLYCTQLGETSYTRTVGDGGGTINTGTHVVTADIILENPNTVLRTTSAVTTASGESMNNNQTSSLSLTKLVLYDGYNFTKLSDNVVTGTAILYRNIPANTWCTLCIPFWPTTSLTMKYPTAFADGTLTFSDVNRTTWGGVDKPMLIKSTSAITAIEGKIASTDGGGSGNTHNDLTSGAGVPMTGVYAAGNVPASTTDVNSYVIGNDNKLHKVTGSSVTIAPFRAYFTLDNTAGARDFINISFDDDVTAINSAKSQEPRANGLYFDLQGRRVAQPTRGLYIVNGRKVVVK